MGNLYDELIQTGALLKGHFKLASGLHSDTYFQSVRLYENPKFFKGLCSKLVKKLKINFDTVAVCAVGGIIPGYQIASLVNKRIIFAERMEGKLVLRRGFNVKKGEKFLIMEDVITTGGTVLELAELLRSKGGIVKQTACLILRAKNPPFKPLNYLLQLNTKEVGQSSCQSCSKGEQVNIPGVKALQV